MRMIVPVPARSISRWIVTATATGGTPGGTGVAGMQGTANATSSVVTDRGALAQAQCTAVWFKRTSPIDRTNKPWSRPIDCISACRKHGDHERNRSSLRVRPILCEPLTDSIRLLDRISGQVYATTLIGGGHPMWPTPCWALAIKSSARRSRAATTRRRGR